MLRHRCFLNLLVLLAFNVLSAQLNAELVGDAVNQGNNCYTITQDLEFQVGGVWFNNPIDFDTDFTIYYQNDFGSKDADGADGMALLFKGSATPVVGNAGGGIGYQGISPSLAIEFDTYQNNIPSEGLLGDPAFDHIAIMRNGNPDHNLGALNLAGPVQASATSGNIEDGVAHEIKIEWIAALTTMNVYFDCELRLSLSFDVKGDIFSNDDSIFFGFVASTGGLSNIHEVCFNSISFVDNLQLADQVVCDGESVTIDASVPSGVSYSWSPTTGVSDPNSADPTFTPTSTTTYTVTIEDVCGESISEDITLTVLPITNPEFDAVAPICFGDPLPALPTVSNNGITGSWSPALNNTSTTIYTFTPDPDQCAPVTTLEIVVNPLIIPTFDAVSAICEGDTLDPLPTVSNNGVFGTWSPNLDNTQTTFYTFTPAPGQGCTAQATILIEVIANTTPIFDTVGPICEGEDLSPLPTTSLNEVSGTWTPALDNSTTTLYTFQPDPDQCALLTTLEIVVLPSVTPQFNEVDAVCQGAELPALPLTSLNGITGSWSPELNNSETTSYTFTPEEGQCAFPVNLEIEVIPNSIPEFDAVDPICPGDELLELPSISNNGITGIWSPALNNTSTTVYTFSPDVGQGCVVETTLEIVVVEPVIPDFQQREPICRGEALSPLETTSLNGITGTWSPELTNEETTVYTFTPDPGQCTNVQVELEIVVIPVSELLISVQLISEPFSANQSIEVTVTGGTGEYEYSLDGVIWQLSNVFEDINGCSEFSVRAREVSKCSNVAETSFRVFDYPRFFTPNGDANNDFWNIKCLQEQQGVVIDIYDRYGRFIQSISPLSSGWDGRYNGDLMPANDYWFKVNYADRDGNPRVLMSHFALRR